MFDLKNITSRPGIYQMLDAKGRVLYVGKAKNLKKRLASYFRKNLIDPKTTALMEHVVDIQTIVTRTENEALLLENNLIKKHRPQYNIFFKDDKSYPYLYLSDHAFPSMTYYRGAKNKKGHYFGPYPNAGAVKETLNLIQKIFKIRQCTDSFFKARTRPCLQYQIKRCSAPCVDYISKKDYARDIKHAELLLKGKNQQVVEELTKKMDKAASDMDYELAAILRDQIASIRKLQQQQYIDRDGGDVDVIAVCEKAHFFCVEVLFIRGGRVLGSRTYFPKSPAGSKHEEVLSAFLTQYYLNEARKELLANKLIVNHQVLDKGWLIKALSQQLNRKVTVLYEVRGKNKQWQKMAELNAEHELTRYLSDKQNMAEQFKTLQKALKLPQLPERLECFDISHTQGEGTVGSCVVFDAQGPKRQDYRRFNIDDITKGDDYAAMKQVLTRRYTRLKKKDGLLPDVIIVDGGKGQLTQAIKVLEELQVTQIVLLGIAKGPGRKAGLETLFIGDDKHPVTLPTDSDALHLLQHIRDEAHRFAITGHRKRRAKVRSTSSLEEIPGVGPKRRRELLRYFGGRQEIARASVEELMKVPGINRQLAEQIVKET